MELIDPHLFRQDPRLKHQLSADAIAAAPQVCLGIALENLQRWEDWGRTQRGPICEWRVHIEKAKKSSSGLESLLHFLRTADPDATPLLSCSPFVGLPTPFAILHSAPCST